MNTNDNPRLRSAEGVEAVIDPDWFNMIAAKRGKPAGWAWFKSEWRGEVILVEGGVAGALFTRGKNKGRPNPKKRTDVCEIAVSRSDLDAIKAEWSATTGKCAECYGDGETVASIGVSGKTYRDCKRCGATGLASIPSPHPPAKNSEVGE